jgi:16S rRNA (guanine966-N2)-methyltransferase
MPGSQPSSGSSKGIRRQSPPQSTHSMVSATATDPASRGGRPSLRGVRVVAGTARGLRLVAPAGEGTRPTSDRVREATFNALGSMGALDGATVLDLYAGSGAMGIEALSRGAASATFVEPDRAARAALEANLATTGLADRATVVAMTAAAFVAGATGRRWDLAVLDPPYGAAPWPELLEDLPAALAVLEGGEPVEPGPGWVVVRQKRYGRTHVAVVAREDPPVSPPSASGTV